MREREMPRGDPLWYKDAIIYEARVPSFYDSDGDGIGDFRGLTERLDYLQDLGITALWLLPFYPSPLRDDGYDISDYTSVHPDAGTLADFKLFLREAHRRGIRVITELVVNHTSDQHPWFQRARRAKPGSRERDFYVWSDRPDKYAETRVIFKDFEPSNWSWDPVAKAYYWHRFYSHQPDLNFDNPAVRRAVFQAMDFWLGLGVDGLRLDAVPYLYEREGTNCENLPEGHLFLKDLRRHVDERFEERMLMGEANQWPEDAAAYFGQRDECHMAFHFPIMPRMFMAIQMEDRYPIVDILEQTPPIPESCQWALFLRNHDELTLEMVTDEERDYMYHAYAHDRRARINLGIRRRLAPLLGNNRKKIELMNSLLLSLPGTPVIYYGDEIGMGDNIYLGDRNGVRTPMQWSGERNAGFSRANPQRLVLPIIVDPEYHYEALNVEVLQSNRHSLLWWMKRLIALRKQFTAFGRGTLEFLHPRNRKVLAFVRRHQGELLLVVANLSRFVQCAELDLSAFRGRTPVELFGRTEFPPAADQPYFLTLGPHTFYWFSLASQVVPQVRLQAGDEHLSSLEVGGPWEEVLAEGARSKLEEALAGYLPRCRWFGGKARELKGAKVLEAIPVPAHSPEAYILLVGVEYAQGDPETYVLPLTFASGERAREAREKAPWAAVARLREREGEGLLYDALAEARFREALLALIARRRHLRGEAGELVGVPTAAFDGARGAEPATLEARLLGAEQTHSSVDYGGRLILKLFRRAEEGVHPESEVGRFLTERTSFAHMAPVAGYLEYRRGRQEVLCLGVLHGYVPNQGDAWELALDEVGDFFERALARKREDQGEVPTPTAEAILERAGGEAPDLAREVVGSYLELARLLGRRTGELHTALAWHSDDPDFFPEPFTTLYQRSLYQSMRNLTRENLQLLRDRLPTIGEADRERAREVLALEGEVLRQFQALRDRKIGGMRVRIHGDYHLGQVLYTGRDFVVIDFEGEPGHHLSERRIKRSPMRDVAGMLRSFHYASRAPLRGKGPGGAVRPEDVPALERWAEFWCLWVSASFLKGYLAVVGGTPLVPHDREEMAFLLKSFLLAKAIYEVGYELNHRPDWVGIPLRGVAGLLGKGR